MFTELYIQDKLKEGIQIGIEQGIEQGSLLTIYSFYQDGTISLETAAAKAGLSPEDFLAKAEALMAEK